MEHSIEQLKRCPSCQSIQFENWIDCQDFTYSQEVFSIIECKSCGLRFTNPRPSEDAIGPYYNNPKYVSHTDTSEGLLFTIYQWVKTFTLGKKAKMVSALTQSKTILDFGAGTGDFANAICNSGFKTFAFEPNDSARLRIAEKYPEINLLSDLSECKPNSIGIISTWHVMEHVHQLEKTLQTFHSILESNGTLVIAVPNSRSFDANFYGRFWAAYDVPRHLYHFHPSSIEALLKTHNFILTQIKPMWFDSYYVSLLSENYKTPNPNIFQKVIGLAIAFIIGSISNLKTLMNTKHCSSIVYIFKKV